APIWQLILLSSAYLPTASGAYVDRRLGPFVDRFIDGHPGLTADPLDRLVGIKAPILLAALGIDELTSVTKRVTRTAIRITLGRQSRFCESKASHHHRFKHQTSLVLGATGLTEPLITFGS